MRLCVYRSGLAKTIWAARQRFASPVLVDGKIVDRASYRLKPGQVISINAQRSGHLRDCQNSDVIVPDYLRRSGSMQSHCRT